MKNGRSLNGSNGHKSAAPIKRKPGRPSLLNNRIATVICGRFAQGRKLRDICKSRYLPSVSTVMDWLIKNPEFSERWQRAKKLRADYFAGKTIDAAESATPETAAVARLQVDVYRWHASKLDTQAYGEKANETHVTTTNNFVVLPESRLRELQERHQRFLEST